jgi:hypothetical protein
MYMNKNRFPATTTTKTPTTKKKVLKKTDKTVKDAVSAPLVLPQPGKYAAPVPTLPLGTKEGLPVLRKGFRYPSGVSEERKIEAFSAVLYAGGKKGTLDVKDLYVALMNRVKDYCNVYDLLPYESSTKDVSIRKKLEYCMRDLREMGYLSPANDENTVTLLKALPPGLKVKKK